MKDKLLFIILSIVFVNLNAQTTLRMDEISKFWSDFERIEEILAELTPNERLDLIYEGINEKFETLYVECSEGRYKEGRFHIIISANGDKNYFELVNNIIEHQPKLKHFIATGFRQASEDYEGIVYEDLNLKIDEMYFIPLELEGGLGMEFFVPNSNKVHSYDTIHNYGSIAIDQLIGEVEFATNIIAYDFYLIEQAKQESKLIPLRSLGEYISKRRIAAGNIKRAIRPE